MRRAVRAIVGRVRSAELAPDVFRRGAGGSRGGSGGVHRPPVFHSGRARRRLGALGGRADPGGEVLGETRPTGVSDGGDGGTRGVHARGGVSASGGAARRRADVFAAAAAVDVGLALSAHTLAGVSVSHLDVAPRHAGLVFATGNTCATAAGIVAVPASGFILEDWAKLERGVWGHRRAVRRGGCGVVGVGGGRAGGGGRGHDEAAVHNDGGLASFDMRTRVPRPGRARPRQRSGARRSPRSAHRSSFSSGGGRPATGPHISTGKMKCRPTTRATTRSTKSSHTAAKVNDV